ncbi:hypothetical protein Syun_002362 [Stephania yunnanensis]|uniref:D-lactate dehydrogenase (cytochrome) n=1 Tax=Stephania yunnanensis TaxID=152371 RepID=A0AAP0LHF3_9MAGN
MAFLSSRLARFASSSSSSSPNRIFRSLLRSSATSNGYEQWQRELFSWSSALVPLALAVSAGSIALDDDPRTTRYSFCDSQIHLGNGGVGGKESTELVVEGSRREAPRELIEELKAICEDNLTLDYDERFVHGKPQNSFHKAVNIPDIVVFPSRTNPSPFFVELEPSLSYCLPSFVEPSLPLLLLCVDHSQPLLCIVDLLALFRVVDSLPLLFFVHATSSQFSFANIKALHVEDMDVVVEPGIGWMDLNEYLAPYGLFFPLDPGPGATIGGMCATRCSGSLAVVLANGDIVKTGSRARKSAAGYDLTRLMIGSEGTLGIITEVTLKLQKIPQYSVVSRVELLDEVQVKAINIANGKHLPEVPTLMFEFIGTEAYAREQTLIVQKIASEHNGSDFVFAEEPEAKKELWKATSCSFFMQIRKEALWACFAMEPGCEAMISDVCVPLSQLAELISRCKEVLDASPLVCTVIAHAGDGNFHTLILFDPDQEDQRQEAERLNHFIVHAALALEGTCTGEHGVGTGKMKYLEKELGIEALRTMKRIKGVLDPNNIMNPGKLIPPHVCF